MHMLFLPYLLAVNLVDAMFKTWGTSSTRATIIAHDMSAPLALPAPVRQNGGI